MSRANIIIAILILLVILLIVMNFQKSNHINTINEKLVNISNKNNDKNKLVLYYMNSCNACINFLPIWKQIIEKYNSNIASNIDFKMIDCQKNMNLCQTFNIMQYPTIILYKTNGNNINFYAYSNDKNQTLKNLQHFIEKNTQY